MKVDQIGNYYMQNIFLNPQKNLNLNYEDHIKSFHDRFNYWCKTCSSPGSMAGLMEGTHPAGTPAPHMGGVEETFK